MATFTLLLPESAVPAVAAWPLVIPDWEFVDLDPGPQPFTDPLTPTSGEFGIGSHGGSPFGGVAREISLVGARATTSTTLEVRLLNAARAVSPSAVGDALNPFTWLVTADGDPLPLTVTGVTKHSPSVFQLSTIERLRADTLYTVAATALVSVNGWRMTAPYSAQFQGVDTSTAPADRLSTAGTRDFDAPSTPHSPAGGTLVIDASGDYASAGGSELVQKLILRGLFTQAGGFFHLPTYGLGLAPKALMGPSDLIGLRVAIERQVKLEPEVKDARARLVLDAQAHILTIMLQVALKPAGQTLQMETSVPLGSVSL